MYACICVINQSLEDHALDLWSSAITSLKELRSHKDRSMGKAVIFHTSHAPISLLNGDSNHSSSVKILSDLKRFRTTPYPVRGGDVNH